MQKKKISISLYSLLLSAIFTFSVSCNSNTPNSQIEYLTLNKNKLSSSKVFVADLQGKIQSSNKLTGVNLSVNIKLPEVKFNTKASSDGQKQGLVNDIKSYKIFITSSNTTPLTGNSGGYFFLNRDSSSLSSGTHTVIFNNVPVGTWFAGVEAFDATDGGGNNITKAQSYGSDGIIKLGVSTGSVTVNPDLSLNPSGGVLSVNLLLQDAVGANVDTVVTPANGNPVGPFGATVPN